jgi:cytochrome c oxidase subunit 4
MQEKRSNLVMVWIALLVLLVLTAGSAWLRLGPWNSVANLVIAVIKLLLVVLFFMRLADSGPLLRVVAITAVCILALLLLLSGTDFFTRRIYRSPWDQPPAGETAPAPVSTSSSFPRRREPHFASRSAPLNEVAAHEKWGSSLRGKSFPAVPGTTVKLLRSQPALS